MAGGNGTGQQYADDYSGALTAADAGNTTGNTGLWGWQQMFKDLQSTDPQKRNDARFRLAFMGGAAAGLPHWYADLEEKQRNQQMDHMRILAGSRAQATTAPGSGGAAQVKGWDPRSATLLLQMLAGMRG